MATWRVTGKVLWVELLQRKQLPQWRRWRRWTKGAIQGVDATSADSAMNALGCRSKISRRRLAAVAKALADAKVNIEAILAVTAGASQCLA
jgi:hypothetical protein